MDEQTKQAWLAEIDLCTSPEMLRQIDKRLKIGTHWSWGCDFDLGTWAALHNAIMLKTHAFERMAKGIARDHMAEKFGADEYYDGTEG